MLEPTLAAHDEPVERALDDLMRATEAFVASWTDAVRRFAAEPPALSRFRAQHEPGFAFESRPRTTGAPGSTRLDHPDPLWDRDLDS